MTEKKWINREFFTFRASPPAYSFFIDPGNSEILIAAIDYAVNGGFQSERMIRQSNSRGYSIYPKCEEITIVSDCDSERRHTATFFLSDEIPSDKWDYYRWNPLPGESELILIDLGSYQ